MAGSDEKLSLLDISAVLSVSGYVGVSLSLAKTELNACWVA
jgi:hypothetical protein